MEISDYIDAVSGQGRALASAADLAGLDAAVPTCPGWRMRDLLRHLGYVHSWAAGYVTYQLTEAVPELTEAEQLSSGPADDKLLDWFADGLAALAEALCAADPAMAAWTFRPAPSPLAFWARRQAHETAIHCADAVLAAGSGHGYPAEFAADGIDELLMGFCARDDGDDAGRAGSERVLLVRAADTGEDWHVRLRRDGGRFLGTGRGCGPADRAADCTVTGTASDLYLLLWNRADAQRGDVHVSGEAGLLASWPANMRVTWA